MGQNRVMQIAVRVTPETYQILQEEAGRLKWSMAHLVNRILIQWTGEVEKTGGSFQFIAQALAELSDGSM